MSLNKQEFNSVRRIEWLKAVAIDWTIAHRQAISMGLCALLVGLFCLFPFFRRVSNSQGVECLQVERAFSAWSAADKQAIELFEPLQRSLKHHPDWEAKYGAMIVQRLLALGQAQLAAAYAKALLERTQGMLPSYYLSFSEHALLIANGKLNEALCSSKILKEQMLGDKNFFKSEAETIQSGSFLYAFNLLRIASLERVTGSPEGELAAWEEFEKSVHVSGADSSIKMFHPDVYRMLALHFRDGEISLQDYIEQRKKVLVQVTHLTHQERHLD